MIHYRFYSLNAGKLIVIYPIVMIIAEITALSYNFVSILCKPNCNATSHLKHRFFSVEISIGSLLFFLFMFHIP